MSYRIAVFRPMVPALVLVLLISLGFASAARAQEPEISVSESFLVFDTSQGIRRDLPLVVSNLGTGALTLTGVALEGWDAEAFTVLDAPGRPERVQPGGSMTLTLRFDPDLISSSSALATLVLLSDDADESELEIDLMAYIAADFQPAEFVGVQMCKNPRGRIPMPSEIECLFTFDDGVVTTEDREVWMIIRLQHVNSASWGSYVFEGPGGEYIETVQTYWSNGYGEYWHLAKLDVAGKNLTPGEWKFIYYMNNDIDCPQHRKELFNTTFQMIRPEQPYDGVWKDAAPSMNFYVQTYDTGSAVVISTADLSSFNSFLDSDFSDGIGGDDMQGEGKRLSIEFISDREALATLEKPRSAPETFSLTKQFGVPVEPLNQGIWKDSCVSANMNYYIQSYSTGSALIIATPDNRDFYVFLDSEVEDGIFASQYGGGNLTLTMFFGEEGDQLTPLDRCFAAPIAPSPKEILYAGLAAPSGGQGTLTNSLGMSFAPVPAGTFTMGSPEGEPGRYLNENPRRQVTLTRAFHLQTTEVTVGQFRSFIQASSYVTDAERKGWAWILEGDTWTKKSGAAWDNPGFAQEDSHPVTCVSFNDVQAFAQWLSNKEGKAYRPPTEAEWEYSSRAGTDTGLPNGQVTALDCAYDAALDVLGWYCGNASSGTRPVGLKNANSWGLRDMNGNVFEWTADYYGAYDPTPVMDPVGPASGAGKTVRGGSWNRGARYCRSAYREYALPDEASNDLGFRLALDEP